MSKYSRGVREPFTSERPKHYTHAFTNRLRTAAHERSVIYVSMYLCIYVSMCLCAYVRMCVCAYVYIYVCMYIFVLSKHRLGHP